MSRNFTWYSIIVIIMILYYFRSQIGMQDMKPPIANKNPLPNILIHSMNIEGKKNMKKLLYNH